MVSLSIDEGSLYAKKQSGNRKVLIAIPLNTDV